MKPGRLYSLFALFISAYLYVFVRVLWHLVDEGVFLNGAALVAGGALPYRDFFETAGPGSFYWLGLFFRTFGSSLIVARALVAATAVATALLLLWMTRRVYRGSYQLLPAVSYVVLGVTLVPVTNHHWDSNLAAVLCLTAVMKWQDHRKLSYLLVAGVLAGLTSCFLQQKGIFVLLAVLGVILASERRDPRGELLRSLACAVAGYALVIGAVGLFFLVNGGFSELVYATILWPIANYTDVNRVPYGYGFGEWLFSRMWRPLLEPFVPSPVFAILAGILALPYAVIVGLPVLCAIAAGLAARHPSTRREILSIETWPLWIGGAALWVSELHRRDILHLVYGSPLLLIVLVVTWSRWCGARNTLRKATLGALACCVLVVGLFQGVIASTARVPIDTRRGRIYAFRDDEALRFLQRSVQPGETVFVYPFFPMYYFLADVPNPTKYDMLMYDIYTKAQFESAINDLDRQHVKWVLWDSQFSGSGLRLGFPNYRPPADSEMELEHYLEQNYEPLGMADTFRILRRRSAGREGGGPVSSRGLGSQ